MCGIRTERLPRAITSTSNSWSSSTGSLHAVSYPKILRVSGEGLLTVRLGTDAAFNKVVLRRLFMSRVNRKRVLLELIQDGR